jgi:Bacterial HORMA domain family 1
MTTATATRTTTFTITHTRYLASKVETDLKRVQRLYNGDPVDTRIANYITELVELLKGGYLAKVTYGFRRDGQWIEPSLIYTAHDLQFGNAVDDDPGRIRASADVTGATFGSFMEHSAAWDALTAAERATIEKSLPFQRGNTDTPRVNGYVVDDRTYSSGGRSLVRASVRSSP